MLAALALGLVTLADPAEAKDSFKIAWSIHVGWMPWGWMADQGIIKKWADKYGITIEVVQVNDHVESINQYTAGGFDGCAITNMDALTIPRSEVNLTHDSSARREGDVVDHIGEVAVPRIAACRADRRRDRTVPHDDTGRGFHFFARFGTFLVADQPEPVSQ